MRESVDQGPSKHHLALTTRMEQQHHDLSSRLDALGRLINSGQLPDYSHSGQMSKSPEAGIDSQALRVFASHRVPCRSWCPCACHTSQKLKLTAPGMMESVLGKMFVGYSGLPVLNKPCDFRVCRDRQKANATMEYWFPWWFVSINVKLHLMYMPRSGPQIQLSTTRRIPDDSQSITFAMQGNIDGLRYLFNRKLAGPRDVSDSRGFTLMRVGLLLTSIL